MPLSTRRSQSISSPTFHVRDRGHLTGDGKEQNVYDVRASHESISLLDARSGRPRSRRSSSIVGKELEPDEQPSTSQQQSKSQVVSPPILGAYNWSEDRSKGKDPDLNQGKENEQVRSKVSRSLGAKLRVAASFPALVTPKSNVKNSGLKPPSDDEQSSRIMVYVRLRPMSTKEREAGAQSCVRVDKQDVYLTEFAQETDYLRLKRLRGRHFTFDAAFSEDTGQQEVYDASTAKLVEAVLQGRNCSVFCYGATGAGKTYTMLGSVENPGVMVLALTDLFTKLKQKSKDGDYTVRLSYLEVYNESVRDLLSPGRALVLREDSKQGITAAGLTQYQAHSAEEVMILLQRGNQNRQTEPTRMNETSSRSHAILQVIAEYRISTEIGYISRVGKLSLIDLAGSERALATDQRTLRSLEGANINRSLLALSSCINALVEAKKHIPFRNSKLTQLLKDSLGGACQTAMIANISPSNLTFGETQNTLHWADRAKEIRTKTCTNEELHVPETKEEQAKLLLQMQKENQELKLQLARLQQTTSASSQQPPDESSCMMDVRHSAPVFPLSSNFMQSILSSIADEGNANRTISELRKTLQFLEMEAERARNESVKRRGSDVSASCNPVLLKAEVNDRREPRRKGGVGASQKHIEKAAENQESESVTRRGPAAGKSKTKVPEPEVVIGNDLFVPVAGRPMTRLLEQRLKAEQLRRYSGSFHLPPVENHSTSGVTEMKSGSKKRSFSEFNNETNSLSRCTRRNTTAPSMLLQPGFARCFPG